MMPFNLTCKEVSALVIARQDRVLPWRDRLALRLHMAVCATCPTFEGQVLTMQSAMRQWRQDANANVDPIIATKSESRQP